MLYQLSYWPVLPATYLVSRWETCRRHHRQYFFNWRRSGVLRLFLVVLYVRRLHSVHARMMMSRTWFLLSLSAPASGYSMISVIVPEPTVRPPSRIANRKPFSSATGVISSTLIATLSPGITISTPSGNVATPVTSVVRR